MAVNAAFPPPKVNEAISAFLHLITRANRSILAPIPDRAGYEANIDRSTRPRVRQGTRHQSTGTMAPRSTDPDDPYHHRGTCRKKVSDPGTFALLVCFENCFQHVLTSVCSTEKATGAGLMLRLRASSTRRVSFISNGLASQRLVFSNLIRLSGSLPKMKEMARKD